MINNKELTIIILKKLNKGYNTLIKKKHGNSPEILLGDLLLAIFNGCTGSKASEILGISPQTFNRTIKKVFPSVVLAGGGQTWHNYLVVLSVHKRCRTCACIKSIDQYTKDRGTYDGLDAKCVGCKKQKNSAEYRDNLNYYKNYYIKNKEQYIFRVGKRRAAKLSRTVPWANIEVIKEIYANCPKGYHVDHIIPLQGEKVSGLHVESNLQYLTAFNNLSKGNKFKV